MRYTAIALLLSLLPSLAAGQEAVPKPSMAESPNIKVLTGLTVPEFEQEMQLMVQALGVNCAFCHVRNNFAAETNDKKQTSRSMVEMTKLINSQFFPNHTPQEGQSKLGKVTCMTCHQGEQKPKSASR
jgi:hypothetical protein